MQVYELLQSFGRISAFNLVVDKETGALKGYGYVYLTLNSRIAWAIRGLTSCFWYRFFEYADASAEDAAIDGLTGMRLGDKVLGVKRATADYGMPGAAWVPPIGSAPGFAPGSLPGTETECVRLTNMVTREELTDPTEAREILEDTQEECAGFGKLTRVLMPLPKGEGSSWLEDPAGVGEVFLLFEEIEGARRAVKSLNGRKFADRVVAAGFITRSEFDKYL